MITKTITSLFQGLAPINEKYYQQAKANKAGLAITYQNQTMEIPFEELDSRLKRKSEFLQDKFSHKLYRLFYYDFKPQKTQKELL